VKLISRSGDSLRTLQTEVTPTEAQTEASKDQGWYEARFSAT